MKLKLQRLFDNGNATGSILYINNKFECFGLEDEFRVAKIKGETRILSGTYEIKFREVVSGLTKRYREKHNWFTWHLELQNVPNFQYVYIHIGNTEMHTDGCILVGEKLSKKGVVESSTAAFKKLYLKVKEELVNNRKVEIEIIDEIKILA